MQVKTPDAVLVVLSEDPGITLAEVAVRIGKSTSAVERAAKKVERSRETEIRRPPKRGLLGNH